MSIITFMIQPQQFTSVNLQITRVKLQLTKVNFKTYTCKNNNVHV